tara:strand:- start:3210 stop:4736 length:1527 start_codon:yes stop_codon:yes gene_type:complete
MINKKTIKYIYFILFISIFSLHFYQLSSQHWSGVLDMDLIIMYNSILLNSGIEQEYRDHPALTTFLLNSFIYKFSNFFINIPGEIDSILDSNNIDGIFQYYFYVSRTINFFLNLLLILFFNKILKKLDVRKDLRFLMCLIFISSIGYLNSLFVIRSENVSLLFLFFSINIVLSKNRDLIFNFFIAGIFFAFAMFAKIQIIFLSLYLIYLIPNINKNNEHRVTGNIHTKNYLFLSLLIGFLGYIIFQIYIQEFPRFQNNKYLDLIFFTLSFIIFLLFFYISKNFKKNMFLFSSMLNGFAFLVLMIVLLDKIGVLQVNDFILLRITNPMHYMTEFTVHNMANGVINFDYIFKNIKQLFSNYNFNEIELLLLILIILINFKNKNYTFVLFFIFIINTLVMNFRYNESYHLFYVFIYLVLFLEMIKKMKHSLSTRFTYIALVVFLINSINFLILKENNFLNEIFNRENAMFKVCNQLKFNISSNSHESAEFIKYWHTKIDDDKIKKICDEIT